MISKDVSPTLTYELYLPTLQMLLDYGRCSSLGQKVRDQETVCVCEGIIILYCTSEWFKKKTYILHTSH